MERKGVLVVDDKENIVELIEMNLERSGFKVIPAYTGKEALEKTKSLSPDLILLDLMLPDIDGFEVCRMIKLDQNTKDIPIIMITAKSEEADKVIGLGLGADDYITKPFGLRELEARIRTVLRRYERTEKFKNDIAQPSDLIRFKDLTIDLTQYQIKRNDEEISLTLTQFKIFKILLENKYKVISREDLLNGLLGDDFTTDTRTIDVHIRNIRKKLQPYEYIETVRGIGYRMK